MKFVKTLGIAVIVLAAAAFGIWQFWGKDLAKDAQVGTAFAAKHVCSCVHVAERTLESCKTDFVQDMSQLTIENDGNITTASAPFGLGFSKAKFEPGLGCAPVAP